MKFYDRLVCGMAKAARALIAIALAVMLMVALLEVARRYFLGASFPWSHELIRFLMIWIAFIGGAAAFNEGGLVLFDLLLAKMPPRARVWTEIFTNILVLAFCAYLLRMAIITAFAPSVARQMAIGLQIPMTIPYLGIPIGLALFVLFSLNNCIKLIPKAFGKQV